MTKKINTLKLVGNTPDLLSAEGRCFLSGSPRSHRRWWWTWGSPRPSALQQGPLTDTPELPLTGGKERGVQRLMWAEEPLHQTELFLAKRNRKHYGSVFSDAGIRVFPHCGHSSAIKHKSGKEQENKCGNKKNNK